MYIYTYKVIQKETQQRQSRIIRVSLETKRRRSRAHHNVGKTASILHLPTTNRVM